MNLIGYSRTCSIQLFCSHATERAVQGRKAKVYLVSMVLQLFPIMPATSQETPLYPTLSHSPQNSELFSNSTLHSARKGSIDKSLSILQLVHLKH